MGTAATSKVFDGDDEFGNGVHDQIAVDAIMNAEREVEYERGRPAVELGSRIEPDVGYPTYRRALEPSAQTCARPTCSERANVRFLFDGHGAVVVLDTKINEYGGSGVLCERHAELLRAPKGWTVRDLRVAAPRLFSVNRFEEPVRTFAQRARKLIEPIAQTTTPLPLDGGLTYALPGEYEAALEMPVTPLDVLDDLPAAHVLLDNEPVPVEVHPNQHRFDLPDQRTPLLARAFEAAEQRVRESSTLSSLIPRRSDDKA